MPASRYPDHIDRALANLRAPLRGGPKMRATIAATVGVTQRAEDLIWEILRVITSIDLAEGVFLDRLGKIVGRGRGGLSDELYRVAIRVQILVNRSTGKLEDLLKIFRVGANDPAKALYVTQGWHSIQASIEGPYLAGFADVIFAALRRAKQAGVRLDVIADAADADEAFLWSEGETQEIDSIHGFGDASDPDVGGRWATVLSSTT